MTARLPAPPPAPWDQVHMGGFESTCDRCGERYVRGGRVGLIRLSAPADCGCALPPPPPVPAEAQEVCATTPPPRFYDELAADLRTLELVYGCCERCGARPDEACDALCGDDSAFEVW